MSTMSIEWLGNSKSVVFRYSVILLKFSQQFGGIIRNDEADLHEKPLLFEKFDTFFSNEE